MTRPSRRAAFERRSAPVLILLNRQPRWVLAGGMLLLTVGGLFVRGPGGAAALLLVAAFFGWLLALSWPALAPAARAPRALTVGALVAVAVFYLAG